MKIIVAGEKDELMDVAKKVVCMNPSAHITLKEIERKPGEYDAPKISTETATYRLMGDLDKSRTAAGIIEDRITDIAMSPDLYPSYLAGAYEAFFRCLRMGIISEKQLSIVLNKSEADISILSRIWGNSGPGGQTEKCKRMIEKERKKTNEN